MIDLQITGAEFEKYSHMNDVLSDVDMGFNRETNEYDVPSVEWDGPYGRHWSRYISEEARDEALNAYQKDLDEWVASYRIEREVKIKAKKAEVKRIAGLSTLGIQFPELANLILN